MSLALFRSELRSAVWAAQNDNEPPSPGGPRDVPTTSPQADVLRRVASGELSVEAALRALGDRP